MSDDEIVLNVDTEAHVAEPSNDERPKYKSWRKKFRKMKVRFDAEMRDNTTLFKDEQKLESLARRLRESNDQILDLLLDINSSLVVPPELRFNIRYAKDWTDDEVKDLNHANEMLAEANDLDQHGRYSQAQLFQVRATLQSHLAAKDAQPLSVLESEVPHLLYDTQDPDFQQVLSSCADNVAFYSYDNEEEYLKRLDIQLGEPLSLNGGDKDQPAPTPFASLSSREMDREVELRNPQSVHNWLKKHHVNLEGTDEKSDSNATAASGKKGGRNLAKKVGDRALERAREREDGSPISSVAGNKTEVDVAEEDAGADEAPSRRRKSRDADETYRPKGGRSGKPKRKREDGESLGRSKKHKTSSIGGISDV